MTADTCIKARMECEIRIVTKIALNETAGQAPKIGSLGSEKLEQEQEISR